MLTTPRVLRRHIFQILPHLLSTHPPSWYHIAPTLTHFPAVPTGYSYTSTFRYNASCMVKMLPHKIAILCVVLQKKKANNNVHSPLHTSPFLLPPSHLIDSCPEIVPVCHLSIYAPILPSVFRCITMDP